MTVPVPPIAPAPYGIAFSIDDLLLVRSWAQQRELWMTVLTDQMLNGAEFEELLVVSAPGRRRRTLTVWRTQTQIFAQAQFGRPRVFESVVELLQALRPTQRSRTSGLLRILGLVG